MKISRTLLAAAAALGIAGYAHAITPYDPSVDASEDMEHDTDTYLPSPGFEFNPLGDPALAGETPGAQAAHLGGAPDFIAGQDWFDIRNGGVGVIEELPSGFNGVAAPNGSYLGHTPIPHSAGNYAIVQFEGGDGPFGRTNRQVSSNPAPGGTGGRTGYWATSDLYIEPGHIADNSGTPDFWWTNAVNSISGATYMSESGMTGTVDPGGLTWTIATTAGVPLGVVPAGSWIGLEVEPKLRVSDGGLDFEHRLYIDGGTHTTLIGSVTAPAAFTGAGAFADLAGPRYNWYTFPENANLPYVLVDNVGWASVPEPGTLSVLALGGLALARRTRRRA